MRRILTLGILLGLLAPSTALAGGTGWWLGGGGGGGSGVGSLIDDVSCTANQTVVRNAGDTAFVCATPAGGGDALVANPLSQFAGGTTSAQMATLITNETGTGLLVFGTSPTLVTPILGTPTSVTLTNATGTAAGLTAGLATALAANGTNCSAGNYPLGVDASGNVESCTAISASATVTGITDDASCTAGQSITRNAGDTAFECSTPSFGSASTLDSGQTGSTYDIKFGTTTTRWYQDVDGDAAVDQGEQFQTAQRRQVPLLTMTGPGLATAITSCGTDPCDINIPPGTVTSVCTIIQNKNSIHFLGAGQGITTLVPDNDLDNCVTTSSGEMFQVDGSSDIWFAHMTIDGKKQDSTYASCGLSNGACGDGIFVHSPGNAISRNLRVFDVEFKNLVNAGVYLSNYDGALIEDNSFTDMGCAQTADGVGDTPCGSTLGAGNGGWTAASNVAVTGQKTKGWSVVASVAAYGSHAIIRNNRVSRTTYVGIEVFGSGATGCGTSSPVACPSQIEIANNDVTLAPSGITLNGSEHTWIHGNVVHGNAQTNGTGDSGTGILVGAGSNADAVIEDNIVDSNNSLGINIKPATDSGDIVVARNRITGNCLVNAPGSNLHASSSGTRAHNVRLEDNIISGSSGCVFGLETYGGTNGLLGHVDIIGNQVLDAGTSGAAKLNSQGIFAHGNKITGNIIFGDTSSGLSLENEVSGSVTYSAGSAVSAYDSGVLALRAGTASGQIQFFEPSASGTNKTTFVTPALAADVAYTLPIDDGNASDSLQSNGSGVLSWAKQSLTAGVTGTLPVANGGTGVASGTSGGFLAFTGSTTLASTAAMTAGNLIIGSGAGVVPTQVSAPAASDSILVSGASSTSAPVWTTATGTGAPVRATTPTLVTPVLGAATGTSLVLSGGLTASTVTTAATATPALIFDDTVATDTGPESQIVGDAVSANNGSLSLQVESGSDNTYVEGLRVFSTSGATTTQLGNASTNFSVDQNGLMSNTAATGAGAITLQSAAPQIVLGKNVTTAGYIKLFGGTSGNATIQTAAVAGTNKIITLPNDTSTLPIATQQLTFAGPTAARTITLPDASITVARTDAANTFTGVQTMTSPAITTPAITGLATGSGVASAATASTLATRDANANLSADAMIRGYTTTATAAGTTTLTVDSTEQQYFTGTTTQTVVLPVTSTLVLGQTYRIVNNSTGLVTVQSSGANTIVVMGAGASTVFTVILTSGTTAASWSASGIIASGTAALTTNAVTTATCTATGNPTTVSATGVLTTDVIEWTPNADISAVTGYAPATAGALMIVPYPSADNVNFKVCNPTTSNITPGAVTLNWRVVR